MVFNAVKRVPLGTVSNIVKLGEQRSARYFVITLDIARDVRSHRD